MVHPVGVTQSITTTSDNEGMHCLLLEIQTKKKIEVILTPRQNEIHERFMGMVICDDTETIYHSATNFPTPLIRDIRYILRDHFTDLWNSPEEFEVTWTILESMMYDFHFNDAD